MASSPGKTGRGPMAISITGAFFFNMETHTGADAVKTEVFDQCQGHPDQRGTYHYHQYSSCMGEQEAADGHAGLVGWSPDGYGIYGQGGDKGGKALDRCNGHTDEGRGYHYHTTQAPPYVLGCYRGQVASARPRCEGGGQAGRPKARSPRRGPKGRSKRRPTPVRRPAAIRRAAAPSLIRR
jgi:hypothetical protein